MVKCIYGLLHAYLKLLPHCGLQIIAENAGNILRTLQFRQICLEFQVF